MAFHRESQAPSQLLALSPNARFCANENSHSYNYLQSVNQSFSRRGCSSATSDHPVSRLPSCQVHASSVFVSWPTVLVVTPSADQVLRLASGVCAVGSIQLSGYIKHGPGSALLTAGHFFCPAETFGAIKVWNNSVHVLDCLCHDRAYCSG